MIDVNEYNEILEKCRKFEQSLSKKFRDTLNEAFYTAKVRINGYIVDVSMDIPFNDAFRDLDCLVTFSYKEFTVRMFATGAQSFDRILKEKQVIESLFDKFSDAELSALRRYKL